MRVLAEIYGLALFACFGFTVVTALLCACFYPLVRSRLMFLFPATRAKHLLAWIAAPIAVGLLLTGFIFLPTALSRLGIASDHCQAYAADFSYRCLLHPLAAMEREPPWFLLLPLSALGLVFLARIAWEFLDLHRLIGAFTRASHPDSSRNIWIVESQWPLAIAFSIPHGRIFISSELVQGLSPSQLAVVLAHERAHLCRHDPTRYFIAQAIACLHVPWLRQPLLADLSLAAEQACDEEAAERVGDRLLVADTIVQVERLFHRPLSSIPALSPSFMGGQVVERVESLLANPQERVSTTYRIIGYVCVGLVVTGLMLAAEPLHQLTEAVLGLLIG